MKKILEYLKRDMTHAEKNVFRWVCLGLVLFGLMMLSIGIWISPAMIMLGIMLLIIGFVGMLSNPNM